MKAMHVIVIIAVVCAHSVSAKMQCRAPTPEIPKEWKTMVPPCIQKMRDQVQEELTAALTYMAMGAHFSRDTINRPGFAKLFFESASEEREHAIKIISYLLMRGELTSEISKLIQNPAPINDNWESGVAALKDALRLESNVTNKIRDIIITCETPTPACEPPTCENPPCDSTCETPSVLFNDYHLVDYLTGDFLEEQYRGQRDLAGKISVLGKMMDTHGVLGEFLFDKKLLNGEL